MNNNYFSQIEEAGIRPSIQRTAVYAYLCEHPEHPTVDTVYSSLSPDYPTLSKTTIYNTLKLFADHGLIQTVLIDEDKVRYDANIEPHLHFKCTKCGCVSDIFNKEFLSKYNSETGSLLPDGSIIKKIQTYIWGTCNNCSVKTN